MTAEWGKEWGDMNSITDLMRFFETNESPMTPAEFKDFWQSLSPEEKLEYRKAELS